LEQRAEERLRDAQRWLGHVGEKLDWCADTAGDKYSVEAKQAAMKELSEGMLSGEEKCALAIQQIDMLLKIAPESKRADLEKQRAMLIEQMKALKNKTTDTKFVKLYLSLVCFYCFYTSTLSFRSHYSF